MRQAHCDLKLFLCLLVILNVGHKTAPRVSLAFFCTGSYRLWPEVCSQCLLGKIHFVRLHSVAAALDLLLIMCYIPAVALVRYTCLLLIC